MDPFCAKMSGLGNDNAFTKLHAFADMEFDSIFAWNKK
jgi:hypothetical protein